MANLTDKQWDAAANVAAQILSARTSNTPFTSQQDAFVYIDTISSLQNQSVQTRGAIAYKLYVLSQPKLELELDLTGL